MNLRERQKSHFKLQTALGIYSARLPKWSTSWYAMYVAMCDTRCHTLLVPEVDCQWDSIDGQRSLRVIGVVLEVKSMK